MKETTTFLFTGDSFITRRIPEKGYPGFDKLIEIIHLYDVKFNNLEITVHDHEGYPEALSGGTWAMTQPVVLDDLCRFGFNLYNTANNHSADYGHGGLLATIENLKKRNLAFAGTGANLSEAAAPAYIETSNARVALIGACSSFHPNAAAGNQRLDIQGRPGLNPLGFQTTYHVTKDQFEALEKIVDETKMNAKLQRSIDNGYAPPLPEGKLNFGGLSFQSGNCTKIETIPRKKDIERIMAAIEEGKRQADYALVSIHSHEDLDGDMTRPAEFLRTFAQECIDKGADAVIGHGPHELRGIEIYKGKPIFYSLGNFIFQTETVAVQPADAYENHGMTNTTTVGEYMDNRSQNGARGYGVQPNIWRSVMAGVTAVDGRITQIQLYPITLHMEAPRSTKGLPELLPDNSVLEYLRLLSEPFGTKIHMEKDMAFINLD